MDWIHQFDLFLFDFDGLLVDTERLHHQAYVRMCAKHGVDLPWSFPRYCEYAHRSADGLKEQLLAHYPQLGGEQQWPERYGEKKQAFLDQLNEGPVPLMPGAVELLEALDQANIKRCVVTHSMKELVQGIRKHQPVLDTIPHWFTREHYDRPKPHSDGYLVAIEKLAEEGDRIIGFEDTPRGLQALRGTSAHPVLVTLAEFPEQPEWEKAGVSVVKQLGDFG